MTLLAQMKTKFVRPITEFGKRRKSDFSPEAKVIYRSAHPLFSVDYYLQQRPDVEAAGEDPLTHFITHGWREGTNPHPLFDVKFYVSQSPKLGNLDPLTHYIAIGAKKGYRPNQLSAVQRPSKKSEEDFFKYSYLFQQLNDVEILTLSGLFDSHFYLNTYADVKHAGIDPVEHYISYGGFEGRDPSDLFSSTNYFESNEDVKQARINPLVHWLRYGRNEGRIFPGRGGASKPDLKQYCCLSLKEITNAQFNDDAFLVSIITPTFNTNKAWLFELYYSVINQTYGNWQWVIVDDGSTTPDTITALQFMSKADSRIKVNFSKNTGISGASNHAVSLSMGNYIALVDHDDLLPRNALYFLWQEWLKDKSVDMFYTDECKISETYELYDFFYKPDWSPIYLESTMYIGHLTAYRGDFLRRIGGFRSKFDGTQDYDLALRASASNPRVRHIPEVCYFWRAVSGSTAATLSAKSYAVERQKAAISEYVASKHIAGEVISGWSAGFWQINYYMGKDRNPLLSYVIPTAGRTRLVRGIEVDLILNCIDKLEKTNFYSNREYIVIHNGDLSSSQLEKLRQVKNLELVVYTPDSYFNFSEKLNLGVSRAKGEYICIMNDDIEAITNSGANKLVAFLENNPAVGTVAPLCIFEDGSVQHNGIVITTDGPSHAGIFKRKDYPGHSGNLRCRREVFGVSGALMILKKEIYDRVGGFDESFPLNYNDVDFCLKIRSIGLSCVVDCNIEVYHFESSSKTGTFSCEKDYLYLKWGDLIDPFYNKNLNRSNPYFEIKSQSRQEKVGISHAPELFGKWLTSNMLNRRHVRPKSERIKFSIGMSVFNESPAFLNEVLASVKMQTYRAWEFIVIDNGSTSNPETIRWLDELERSGLAKVIRHEHNRGIIGANQSILKHIDGDYLIPIDADDYLTVDALSIMAYYIESNPKSMIFYSDEFKTNIQSQKFSPFFKPDFDPVLLTNCCYPTHLMAIKKDLLQSIRAYSDIEATWCHDYDTVTRALGIGERPFHVPYLLYGWRIHPNSTAADGHIAKPQAIQSQRFVLDRMMREKGLENFAVISENDLFEHQGMWRVKLLDSVIDPTQFDGAGRLTDNQFCVSELKFRAQVIKVNSSDDIHTFDTLALAIYSSYNNCEWISLVSDYSNHKETLAALLEVTIIDEDVVGAGTLILDSNKKVAFSGGLFTAYNTIIDPYLYLDFGRNSGYHGQLLCQRCVDILPPINVILNKKFAASVIEKYRSTNLASFLIAYGAESALKNKLIAITPHTWHSTSEGEKITVLTEGSELLDRLQGKENMNRWYNENLSPYLANSYQLEQSPNRLNDNDKR